MDEEGRCGLCRLGLNGFDAAYAFGAYEGRLRELIHLFKYQRIRTLAAPLGRFLIAALPREAGFDVVTPLPLDWRRRWSRGFNQSELLAREVARRWGVPLARTVRRTRATAPQAGLTRAERRVNVGGAFSVRRPEAVRGRRVLLIDDVLTTGATASACAGALKRAGARSVTILTLARADRRLAAPEIVRRPAPAPVLAGGAA